MLDLANARHVLNTLGLGEIKSMVPMEGGSSPVYRLEIASGAPLILKLYPDLDHLSPAKDAYTASLLEGLDIPTTRFLVVDETRQKLPVRFAITNHLPGAPLVRFSEHPDRTSASRQMGAALRKFHTVPMPAYGFFNAEGALVPETSNSDLMSSLIPEVFTRFEALGGDKALAHELRSILDQQFDAVVLHSPGPVFAHNDLQPGNVLFTETPEGALQLSGVVDYGSVCAADGVSDLAKCVFCSEHDMPGSTPHILAGYGPIDHPNPEMAIAFYTLVHRMIMWNWLRGIGVIATADARSDLTDALRETARANR
jgi:aminoglycoside phosphotransferase (APT) family kinase protein